MYRIQDLLDYVVHSITSEIPLVLEDFLYRRFRKYFKKAYRKRRKIETLLWEINNEPTFSHEPNLSIPDNPIRWFANLQNCRISKIEKDQESAEKISLEEVLEQLRPSGRAIFVMRMVARGQEMPTTYGVEALDYLDSNMINGQYLTLRAADLAFRLDMSERAFEILDRHMLWKSGLKSAEEKGFTEWATRFRSKIEDHKYAEKDKKPTTTEELDAVDLVKTIHDEGKAHEELGNYGEAIECYRRSGSFISIVKLGKKLGDKKLEEEGYRKEVEYRAEKEEYVLALKTAIDSPYHSYIDDMKPIIEELRSQLRSNIGCFFITRTLLSFNLIHEAIQTLGKDSSAQYKAAAARIIKSYRVEKEKEEGLLRDVMYAYEEEGGFLEAYGVASELMDKRAILYVRVIQLQTK